MENSSEVSPKGSDKRPFEELNREELIKKCKGLLTIAHKSKQAKLELQNEVESYKLKLDQCATEKNTDNANIKTLQEIVDSLTDQKLCYTTEKDVLQNKIKTLTDACKNYEDHKSNNDQKIAELSSQLSSLDSQVISLKRQNSRLIDDNEQLIKQLSEMETRAVEFNEIGLQQQEQLYLLESKVNAVSTPDLDTYRLEINNLNEKIMNLETEYENHTKESNVKLSEYDTKLKEMTSLYEAEKDIKEKGNMKLKSYRDKISKCAVCINQLKNSRYILSRTIKEYSENIPKWQNDIMRASKILDEHTVDLNKEIKLLREKVLELEQQNKTFTDTNTTLANKIIHLDRKIAELLSSLQIAQSQNYVLDENFKDTLHIQTKSLEAEKSILVKEKLIARDCLSELEKRFNAVTRELQFVKSHRDSLISELKNAQEEKKNTNAKVNKNDEELKKEVFNLQQQYEMLRRENANVRDVNTLLKEELETLQSSLQNPNDEENSSDLNNSLQVDIVKLETKLSAYKQENAALLIESKENRSKLKEYDAVLSENEEIKSKLSNYKTENAELLHEMKEINQVLKERGESISKHQKTIAEMDMLIETLEKSRNDINAVNEDLQRKYDLLQIELKNVQELSNINKNKAEEAVIACDKALKEAKKSASEHDNALKHISEKDAIIATLEEEMDKLKHHQSTNMELPSEDMSTSTISKAEEHFRMKDLDDSFEEKYTKLRIFALKLKKKLQETSFELENAKKDKDKLEKMLNDNGITVNVNSVNRHNEDLKPSIMANVNSEDSELQNKLTELSKKIQEAEDIKTEVEKYKAELALKEEQLANEVNAHKACKETLDKVKRDVKKKSVLSLEMEDYERSMKEITSKMEEKTKKMVQMESTIDTQQGTINAMKTQIKLFEDQLKTEENQSRIVREELQCTLEEGKEKDKLISVKNEIIIKMEHDLEDQKTKYEELNIEMTTLLGEKEKSITSLCEDKLELNSKVKRLEFKCTELEDKLRIMNIELEDLKAEYTSYKVRAQAVLRQNQTVDHSQEERLKEETAALKVQIEALTNKLRIIEEQYEELKSSADNERRRSAEASAEITRATQRTGRLQADIARLAAQLETERTQHKLQVTTLTQCYKSQISELETKINKETEELKKKLALANDRNVVLNVQDKVNKNIHNPYMSPVLLVKEEGSDSDTDINVTMLPREEGEGSESAPSPLLSKQYPVSGGGSRSPVPLDRLLEEGVPEDDNLDAASLALTPEQELSGLRLKLQAQVQRVKHVTVLLAESERECARYAQMNELLKAEVRRARGSLERTEHAHNAEYMKNVTLKFVTLPPGDERNRLVPVLQKILTLNPNETQQLTAVARGTDPNSGRGWGSYLPWPGGK